MLSGDSLQDFAPLLGKLELIDESEEIAIRESEDRADRTNDLYERSLDFQVSSNSWRSQ